MRYTEALKHLYSLCDCVDWDSNIVHRLISIEAELNYLQCIQQEQSLNTKDIKDQ
jgi:hypothetical protein